jgi:hypothetical protein
VPTYVPLILRLCGGFVQHISKQIHITVRLVLPRSTAIYIGIVTHFAQSTHIMEKHWLLVSLFQLLLIRFDIEALHEKFVTQV